MPPDPLAGLTHLQQEGERAVEEGTTRAEREIAALRERSVAVEKALPAHLKDEDDEA